MPQNCIKGVQDLARFNWKGNHQRIMKEMNKNYVTNFIDTNQSLYCQMRLIKFHEILRYKRATMSRPENQIYYLTRKKKTFRLVNFIIQTDHSVKIKDRKKTKKITKKNKK